MLRHPFTMLSALSLLRSRSSAFCLIVVLSTFVGGGSRAIADPATSQAALQPWAEKFIDRLEAIEADTATAQRMLRQMRLSGMPPREDKERWLIWLRDAPRAQIDAYRDLGTTEAQARRSLLEFMRDYRDPTPIIAVDPDRLVEEAGPIVGRYRALVMVEGARSEAEHVQACIPKLIDAMDSKYTVQAILILQQCVVASNDFLTVDHWWYFGPIRNGAAIRQVFNEWYKTNASQMKWDDGGRHYEIKGVGSAYPKYELKW